MGTPTEYWLRGNGIIPYHVQIRISTLRPSSTPYGSLGMTSGAVRPSPRRFSLPSQALRHTPQSCSNRFGILQAGMALAAGVVLQLAIEAAGDFEKTKIRDAMRELDVETFVGRVKFSDSQRNVGEQPV
eukprot:1900138-Rhodomonas_salina.1